MSNWPNFLLFADEILVGSWKIFINTDPLIVLLMNLHNILRLERISECHGIVDYIQVKFILIQ